jgi:ATP-dependent DNA helicase PIF1
MIYGFDLSKNHPPVQQLQLHLPDMHMVAFHKRDKVKQIINRPSVEESMLTSYFDANKHHEEAREILYWDFPEHFTWQTDGKFWQKRKTLFSMLAESSQLILPRENANNVPGATSYKHLRTVDGVLLPSFRKAMERKGLIEEDNTLDECLTKATLFQMPSSL